MKPDLSRLGILYAELKAWEGPLKTSKPGNSVYFEIGVWYEEDKESIHIASNDVAGFHTTVRRDAKLKRGHPNLFRKLAKVLRDGGAPAPEEESSDAVSVQSCSDG